MASTGLLEYRLFSSNESAREALRAASG